MLLWIFVLILMWVECLSTSSTTVCLFTNHFLCFMYIWLNKNRIRKTLISETEIGINVGHFCILYSFCPLGVRLSHEQSEHFIRHLWLGNMRLIIFTFILFGNMACYSYHLKKHLRINCESENVSLIAHKQKNIMICYDFIEHDKTVDGLIHTSTVYTVFHCQSPKPILNHSISLVSIEAQERPLGTCWKERGNINVSIQSGSPLKFTI